MFVDQVVDCHWDFKVCGICFCFWIIFNPFCNSAGCRMSESGQDSIIDTDIPGYRVADSSDNVQICMVRFMFSGKHSRDERHKKSNTSEPRKKSNEFEPRRKSGTLEPRRKSSMLEPRRKSNEFEPPKKGNEFEPRKKNYEFEFHKKSEFEPYKKNSNFEPRKQSSELIGPNEVLSRSTEDHYVCLSSIPTTSEMAPTALEDGSRAGNKTPVIIGVGVSRTLKISLTPQHQAV